MTPHVHFTLGPFEDKFPRWGMLSFLGLFVFAFLTAPRLGGPPLLGVYKVWLFLACVQAVSVGWRTAVLMVRGRAVLGSKCAPSQLIFAWRGQVLRDSALPLLILVGLSVALLAQPFSPWNWYTGAGWILASALASFALGLHSEGALRLPRTPLARYEGPQKASRGWRQLVSAQLRRYSALGESNFDSNLTFLRKKPDAWVRLFLLPFVPMGFLPGWAMSFSWGGPISVLHVLGLWLGVSLLSGRLLFRDLTWRQFLLPGGHLRGTFGRHILVSTLPFIAIVWVPAVLLFCVAKAMYLGQDFLCVAAELLWQPKAGIVLAEVLLVFALAVLTRSLGKWWQALCLVAIVVFGGLAVASYGFDTPTLFTAGPTYIAILLSITVVAVLLADRMWTTRKLMPQML